MANRRDFLKLLSGSLLMARVNADAGDKAIGAKMAPLITKAIPRTGEQIPVIGMGSSRTFDVPTSDKQALQNLTQVLQLFFDGGGALIDSSPMYGAAESALGETLKRIKNKPTLFAATKVWTDGKENGIVQMHQSQERMGVKRFDLMQIHNLRDWQVHLNTLRHWKLEGKIRYIGITTSHGRSHHELEKILLEQDIDFVQLSYNIVDRAVEERLLPIALEKKIAVIVNRPFKRGDLFKTVKGKELPQWSREFCHSWGQFFLKYVVSHPAVTNTIPATSSLKHMQDNMRACKGNLPNRDQRLKMQSYFASL